MKSIKNLKKEGLVKELSKKNQTKVYGGNEVVNVGNTIVDDLNGLIR